MQKMNKKDIEAIYYLSPLQQGLLFHAVYERETDPYVSQTGFILEGVLKMEAFEHAWQTAVDRHPILRTGFVWDGVEKPLQLVHRTVAIPIQRLDWRDLTEKERREALTAWLQSDRRTSFDLVRPPIMRLTLMQIADDAWYFINSHHHILLDGWSFSLVLREALAHYEAFTRGASLRLPLPRPYREYIAWLKGQDLQGAEHFWRESLAGLTAPTPLVVDGIPLSSREPVVDDSDEALRFAEQRVRLSKQRSDALRTLAQRLHVTLNTIMQGAWALLMHRYSGEEDLVFGATVSGRPPDLPGSESMIGLFINTLPVRTRVSGDELLSSWLRRLQEQNSVMRQYEFTPLAAIQRWSELAGGRSLFESLVVFDNYPDEDTGSQPSDLNIRPFQDRHGVGISRTAGRNNYPMSVIIEPNTELGVILCYEHRRFQSHAMTRMLRHYGALLDAITNRPDARMSEFSLLDHAERQQLVVDWSGIELERSADICVQGLFESQARRKPEAVAVVSEEGVLCYRELDVRADQVARHLQRLGVGPEVRVGLCVERSLDMIVGILAVLKAGGAYVPLDPKFPPARLAFILADSGARLLLTQAKWHEILGSIKIEQVEMDQDHWSKDPVKHDMPLTSEVRPDNLAYLIYTSGSTGRPKGVAVEHRQLVNYVRGVLDRLALGEETSFAMVSTVAADLGHTALFGALCSGRTLHVVSSDRAFDPDGMADYMHRHRIDALKIVPSHLRALLDSAHPQHVVPARCLILGGEVLSWDVIDRVRELAPGCTIINHYGPTETTVGAVAYHVAPELARGRTVPIGRPLAGSRTYILDQYLDPVPIGIPGELYIGGGGVARGYAGHPELTAERFLPDPFGGRPGGRLYRTGDQARYLSDGTIEFLGRSDNQVKLRGFRIELGEIKAQLLAEPDVREAVVMLRAGQGEAKRLAAYVVPAQMPFDVSDIRTRLAQRLPEYMIPGVIIPLEAWPLTANGKLDREALPDPDECPTLEATTWAAPRNRTEEILAEIWAEVLGRERVGIHENFFDLGGDSILSLQIIARAHRQGLKLTPKHLFEHHTIAAVVGALAEQASPAMAHDAAPQVVSSEPFVLAQLEPRQLEAVVSAHGNDVEDIYPASPVQHGMLFHSLMAPESSAYLNQLVYKFTRGLDVEAFERAWQQAIDRHAILRTGFVWEGAGEPLQMVHRSVRLPVQYLDWRGLSKDARGPALQEFLAEDRRHGFQFDHPPLMRMVLMRLDDQTYWMVWTLHHAMLDGWCQGLLVREVLQAYEHRTRRRAEAMEPAVSYREYIAWLRRQDRAAAERFWRNHLNGFRSSTRLPQITDDGRAVDRAGYGEQRFELSDAATRAVHTLAQSQRVTVNTVIQAAWAILLAAHSGEEDVVFGVTVAGRPADLLAADSMLGVFINTLPMRVRVSPSRRFADWLRELQDLNVELRQYEYSPLADVHGWSDVDRGTSLFESILVFQNYPMDEAVADYGRTLGIEVIDVEGWTNYPLTIVATPGTKISLTLSYDRQHVDESTMQRIAEHWTVLLEAMAARPNACLAELGLLTESERRRLLVEWNSTERPYVPDCLHHLIEAQVERTPEAIAVVFGNERLTYRELSTKANQLAQALRRRGVGPDSLVGLCVERSLAMLVGLLGILKAGGAYLPLDPTYPKDRLAYMLQDARVPVLLTQQSLLEDLPASQAHILCLDRDWPMIARQSTDAPGVTVTPDALAYVIYTSGSTGRPKGVMVCHRNIVNFLNSMVDDLRPTAGDVVLAVTSLSFDIAVLEIFLPLCMGAKVVLADRETAVDGERLAALLNQSGATLMQATPATWRMLLATGRSSLQEIQVLCGGEAFPPDLAARFLDMGIMPWNLYGPTETAVWSAIHRVIHAKGSVPLGHPIANTRIHLLDRALRPVPIGTPGELYIGGAGVTRGYLNRPDLTAEKFIPDPFSAQPGCRLYKTGDLACYRADGTLDFLGRLDHQVKLRGFRIELGEIEAHVSRHSNIRDVVVIAREDRPGDTRLTAYVVGHCEPTPSAAELRQFLLESLPDYMVPSAFVSMPALPLTPNLKVDRKALPRPDAQPSETSGAAMPRTATEEILSAIWADVLGVAQIGVQDRFFDLGGHSLLATQVMSRLRSIFQVDVPLRALFEGPTVAELAKTVEAARLETGTSGTLPLQPVPREAPLPLSFAQQRLWFLAQLEPDGWFYNLPFVLRLKGMVDVSALEESFRELIRRHEVLRTTFATIEGEPVQIIAPEPEFSLSMVDLTMLARDERDAGSRCVATEEAQRPFDLSKDQPIRGRIVRMEPGEYLLLVTLHHIAADAWSLTVLVRELTALYVAIRAGRPSPLPPLPVQYADFAQWQRRWLQGPALERHQAYWRGRLGPRLPVLTLQTDYPRPEAQTYRGARCVSTLPGELTDRLVALSRAQGVTMFMLLLAAFQVLLARSTGQTDVVVGTDVANRTRTETEGLIGFFVNLLVLRTDLSGDPTFAELLRRVREGALGAYAHQDLPFDKLVEALKPVRDPSRNPLAQVLFVLQNAPTASIELPGLRVESVDVDSEVSRFDLGLFMDETEEGLVATWKYNADLFTVATITRLAAHFTTLLQSIVSDPAMRLSKLDLLTEMEKEARMTEDRRREENNLKKLKSMKPKSVNLAKRALIKKGYLVPGQVLPLVIRPAVDDVDLAAWAKDSRPAIEDELHKHGALLFRDFPIASVPEFERFAQAMCPELYGEYGDLPKEESGSKTYRSTPYPPDQAILFHNESSHLHRWPMKQWFFCLQAAREGGETPIVDCRTLYQRLRPEIRERFASKQLLYVRNFTPGFDVSWQDFFQTTEKSVVEERCRKDGIEFIWMEQDRLRTRQRCPAIMKHPKTGEPTFFNQIQLHHVSCLDSGVQDSLLAILGEEWLPRNVYYGDGSSIEEGIVSEMRELTRECAVQFAWQEHDILMVDNMLVAHGRQPFSGPRKIVVAMGEMVGQSDIQTVSV
jgi:amino acid adenylation domain-containing protein